jgi:hypothetical protein
MAGQGWSGNEEKLADRRLGLEVAVCRSGVVEGACTADEDARGADFDPPHDLPRALALFGRLLGSAADGYRGGRREVVPTS